MKKALSLLASLGLVATSSMAVVSCTKQDTTPVYKDASSVNGMYLTSNNDVIPFSELDNKDNVKQLILGSAANHFKNSEKAFADLNDKYTLTIDSTDPLNKTYPKDNNGKEIEGGDWITGDVKVIGKPNDSKKDDAFVLTVKVSKDSKLKLVADAPVSQALNGPQSDQVINNLRTIANDAKRNYNSTSNKYNDGFEEIESSGYTMGNFDDLLLNYASQNYLPGLKKDKDSKVVIGRYASAYQQIKDMLSYPTKDKNQKDVTLKGNDVLIAFNNELLESMKSRISKFGDGTTPIPETTMKDAFDEAASKVLKAAFSITLSLSTDSSSASPEGEN